MKKFLFASLLTLLAVSGQAQRGRASAGVRLGYALDYETATIGVDYRRDILPDVRLALSQTYMIRNNGMTAWYMDADAHYVVTVSPMFSFYPIGGCGLSVWSPAEVEGSYVRPGLNVGLGGELRLTREIAVGVDMKYNLVQTYHQALIAARVAWYF